MLEQEVENETEENEKEEQQVFPWKPEAAPTTPSPPALRAFR